MNKMIEMIEIKYQELRARLFLRLWSYTGEITSATIHRQDYVPILILIGVPGLIRLNVSGRELPRLGSIRNAYVSGLRLNRIHIFRYLIRFRDYFEYTALFLVEDDAHP